MKKYIVFGIISVFLIVIIGFFGFKVLNKNKDYKNLEDNMEQIVASYLGQYIEEYPETGEKRINITSVIDKKYNIDMQVNEDLCEGYVVVKKVSFAYEYDSYIKCNNYVTKGYEK